MRTTTLPNKAVIYLPKSRQQAPAVKESLIRILNLAGGLTVQEAMGSWVGDGDNIVEESILPVRVLYGSDWRQRHDLERELQRLAETLLNLGEAEVLIEFNGGAVLHSKE